MALFAFNSLIVAVCFTTNSSILATLALRVPISAFTAFNWPVILTSVATKLSILAFTASKLTTRPTSTSKSFIWLVDISSTFEPSRVLLSVVILFITWFLYSFSCCNSSKVRVVLPSSQVFLYGSFGYWIYLTILCLSLKLSFLDNIVIVSPKKNSKKLYSSLYLAKSYTFASYTFFGLDNSFNFTIASSFRDWASVYLLSSQIYSITLLVYWKLSIYSFPPFTLDIFNPSLPIGIILVIYS